MEFLTKVLHIEWDLQVLEGLDLRVDATSICKMRLVAHMGCFRLPCNFRKEENYSFVDFIIFFIAALFALGHFEKF